MKRIIVVIILCFTGTLHLKAQDSTAIVSYVDKIIIKANLNTQRDVFTSNYDNNETDFKITTNDNLRLFLSLDYDFIGFSIGFDPNFLNENNDNDLKGKSSFSDFRFRMFLGKWVQSMHYGETKGFYIENTEDFIPDWNEGTDPYIQFPNLKKTSYGMTTAYVFNSNFSYRNLVYQTEWQKKSAGSFVPKLYYNYNELSFKTENVSSIEKFYNLKLELAYYYTFVIHENWFIAPYIAPAAGVRFSKTKTERDNETFSTDETHYPLSLSKGLQLGYSSRRIIFGLNINNQFNWFREDSVTAITEDRIYGLVYFGYRFDAPKFLDNTFNWMYSKLGMTR